MALFLSIFPIVLLIWLMVKKNSMPSYVALPITAALIYAIKLFYFGDDAMLLNATAASGLVSTLTPITVIFGAYRRHPQMAGHHQPEPDCPIDDHRLVFRLYD